MRGQGSDAGDHDPVEADEEGRTGIDRVRAAASRLPPASAIRARHPRFLEAVIADARITAAGRGEQIGASRAAALRHAAYLLGVSDGFIGLALYRAKARLQQLGIPVLPRIAHRLAIALAGVCIGDPVVVRPGVHLIHGQVVIDGLTEIRSSVTIAPFVLIGIKVGSFIGPTIGPRVQIGTGSKVLGEVEIGARAKIGANSVVLDDVPADAVAVGAPARVLKQR